MRVELTDDAKADLESLQEDLQELALGYIYKLEYEPIGLRLENKHGYDLRGCFKIYFGSGTTHRIIWYITADGDIKIIKIIAVGEREGFQVYKDAYQRYQKEKTKRE